MLNRRSFFYIPALIAAAIVVINLSRSVIGTYRASHRLTQLQQQVELTKRKIVSLQEKLEKQQADEFVEEQARNKLNLIKPGEKIVIVGKNPEKENGLTLGEKQIINKPNWIKWRYLFFQL